MISKQNQKRINAYMNMLDTIKREEDDRAKINVYMDLCNVIVKEDARGWTIDSPDAAPGTFNTRAELMEYIENELTEIRGAYIMNGEFEEYRAICQANGLDV